MNILSTVPIVWRRKIENCCRTCIDVSFCSEYLAAYDSDGGGDVDDDDDDFTAPMTLGTRKASVPGGEDMWTERDIYWPFLAWPGRPSAERQSCVMWSLSTVSKIGMSDSQQLLCCSLILGSECLFSYKGSVSSLPFTSTCFISPSLIIDVGVSPQKLCTFKCQCIHIHAFGVQLHF